MQKRVAAAALAFIAAHGALAAGAPFAAAGAPEAADAVDRVMQLFGDQPHRRARFVERRFLAILDRPLVSSGELLFDAPNRLVKRTLEPRPQTITIVGDQLSIVSGRKRRVLDLRDYPQIAPFVDSIRATLAGDRAELARHFAIEFEGDVAHWTLRLTPNDAALARTISRILMSGARGELTEVDIRETDGDHSSMRIDGRGVP